MQSKFATMKLSNVVPLGFSAIIVVMAINGLISKLTVNGLVLTASEVMHSYRVQTKLQELEETLVDVQLGERGFILTKNEDFLQPYKDAQKNLPNNFKEAKSLLKDDPVQSRNLEEVEELSQQGINSLTKNIALIRAGKSPSQANLVEGKQGLETVRDKIDNMLQAESDLLARRQRSVSEAEQFSTFITLGGTILGTILGFLIVSFVVRRIVKPIDEVTKIITNSSTEIAATVEQQERTAAEQSVAVNQTTATMHELGASSRATAEQAEAAAAGAKQVLILVDSDAELNRQYGKYSVSEFSLRERVRQIAREILRLSEQTNQIGTISTLVSNLANQTNMLALNAAVEAVRAGEQGKGFAVVAAEIRKLADESHKSAEKINSLVIEIQKATDSTAKVTEEGTKTVESIVEAIENIAVNSQQISLTAKEQAIAIQQVAQAMNTIERGAVQTASGITQTKNGTHKLNEAATTLKAVV
ncbi:methyl-accepting chemotaxis protein [Microcoleus sp. FACHB-672]|uniref:methyl-accepting chemotaxis protein n=1 Tax=Microcoleus sp. FACHB-672 TaxID=2692825 RepID=UPI001682D9C4|nr:methyl-accepting chemotaxis protein [Microcoleus sp. FACHB-672]MBD2043710.1 CHASE3 domain-containing protein [Microcoleus sp. FACHB-672]